MKLLDLFSGVGMHALGFHRAGIDIIGFCEIEPYCRAVLAKNFPGVPIHDDVKTLTTETVLSRFGRPDIISGGFPCQDVSLAGRGGGIQRGNRSGLWREMFRLIRGTRPAWLVIENVPALRGRGSDKVLGPLERIGYSCEPVVVGAEAAGYGFERERVWIVASANLCLSCPPGSNADSEKEDLCDHRQEGKGVGRVASGRGVAMPFRRPHGWEEPRILELAVGVAVDGDAERLVRFANDHALHSLGNGNPPHVPELIGRWILAQEGGGDE